MHDKPNVTTAYALLYKIMKDEWLSGDKDNEAPTYTRIAFEYIMGCKLDEAIRRYTPATILGAVRLFLDNDSMECTCPPDWTSENCFECTVTKLASSEIRARDKMIRQGVLND